MTQEEVCYISSRYISYQQEIKREQREHNMLWIAVCDDEVRECSRTAGKIRGILDEMKVSCTIRQFYSGQELLRSPAFIIFSRDRQSKKLFLDDILYFEIKGRVIDAHGTSGIFSYYEQIGLLERELQGKGFFRCHKSYLVNLKYVDVYNRQELVLDNGERIAIAKRRYEAFCREILQYMREKGGIV